MQNLAVLAEIAGFLLILAGSWSVHPGLFAVVVGVLVVAVAQVVERGDR